MDIKDIKLWIDEMQAEKKAYEGFWKNINNYREEDSEEFEEVFPNYSPEFLEVRIQSVSITYANYPDFNYNHVVIDIPVRYCGKNKGVYRVLLKFDGDIEDDFFIID